MIKTLEAVIRRQWLPPEFAVREVVAFERRFGMKHLSLACHAALPLFLSPELVNLININFLDSENVSWIAESDFLLSPLCRPMDRGVFEVEPCVREVLLVELENRFGWRRPFEVADFLGIYLKNQPNWKQCPEQTHTQKWIAQAYLNPDRVVEALTDFLDESLPEENPILGLPDHIEIPKIVEILAEPLERTSIDLWSDRQYLVNTSRALAQIFYGEEEDLREKIIKEIASNTEQEGFLLLSPVIRRLLTDIEITPVQMGCALILTALPIEYITIRSHLTDLQEEIHLQETIYERGKFVANGKFWEVGIVEIGAGNYAVSVATERAIRYFNPNVVLFVGVASGIKDVRLGDVVAATKVYGYESGQVKDEFKPRPELGVTNYSLIQKARVVAETEGWLQRLTSGVPNPAPRVLIAPIASREKVFVSKRSNFFQMLESNYADAVAIEMEGIGFLTAIGANQQVSALIIRGICDLIDDNRTTDTASSQKIAAQNASAFTFEILANLDVNEVSNTTSGSNKSTQPVTLNFFALDDTWVGRESLIQDLSNRMRGPCRLLILVGITGIGKTALGERLAVELSDWFEEDWSKFHEENFKDEQQSNDFASVAARWLEKWGELITPEDRKDTQRLLYRLVRHLKENRYLVQLDSLENILQGNEEEGWSDFKDEWWVRFFESLLTADSCESCIILTSQDLPAQLPTIGTRYQNFWYCQPLSGLEETERLGLFDKTGLDVDTEPTGKLYLERIGRAYEGHPLALRVIAGEIRNQPFDGNVRAYWNQYGREVEEVEKAIEEAKTKGITASADDKFNLHRYTRSLRRQVRTRLEKTFNRLQKDVRYAYILLCEASVYRCPVPEDFWLSHLEDWDRDEDEQQVALDALRDRYLVEGVVEGDRCLLRQHNLIRSVSLEHLKQLDEDDDREINITPDGELVLAQLGIDGNYIKGITPRHRRMEYRAVINWLTQYHPQPDASNLDKVRGYLEAFGHLCNVENWEAASKILLSRINTPSQEELYKQLGIWSYYHEQIKVCSQILGKLNGSFDINLLNILGNSYYILGNYMRAMEYLQQSLTIAQEIQDDLGQENALVNLGKIYQVLGDYSTAIEYHQQSLTIAREIGDRRGEEQALTNLGSVYANIGNYANALKYSQQSLASARQINNHQGEGQALANIGNIYLYQGQYNRAIEYHQQSLVIAQEIGDRRGEQMALGSLGVVYESIGDYAKGIEYNQESLLIAQEIGDRRGEEQALTNLGLVYAYIEDYVKTIEYSQQSLEIAREIGDRQGEGEALGNIGFAYHSLGQYDRAISYYQYQLQIAREIGYILSEGVALYNLGNTLIQVENYVEALDYFEQSLDIFRRIGSRPNEAEAMKSLAEVHQHLGHLDLAIEFSDRALAIATELGIPLANECQKLKDTLTTIGRIDS